LLRRATVYDLPEGRRAVIEYGVIDVPRYTAPLYYKAEAYIVAAFTRAGVPMRRIRPAVLWLQEHIGLPQARASQRPQTDGAEVLWDFGKSSGDPADQDMADGLVVVRSGQQVFRPVERDYLTRVTYEDGWTRKIPPSCWFS
jgi:hypothetical protein